MDIVDCSACADRDRRHCARVVLTILLSPFVWVGAAGAALGGLFRPHPRQPRLCVLTGNRPLRRDLTRVLRHVLAELARFETKGWST
jgi:hypothetical protein